MLKFNINNGCVELKPKRKKTKKSKSKPTISKILRRAQRIDNDKENKNTNIRRCGPSFCVPNQSNCVVRSFNYFNPRPTGKEEFFLKTLSEADIRLNDEIEHSIADIRLLNEKEICPKKHLKFSVADENLEYVDFENEGPKRISHLIPQTQVKLEFFERRSNKDSRPPFTNKDPKEMNKLNNRRFKSLQGFIPKAANLNDNPFPLRQREEINQNKCYEERRPFYYQSTKTGSKSPCDNLATPKLSNFDTSILNSSIQVEDPPIKPILAEIKRSYTRCICQIPNSGRESDSYSCASTYRANVDDTDEHEFSVNQLPKVSPAPSRLPCGEYCKRLSANEEKRLILFTIRQLLQENAKKPSCVLKESSSDTLRDFIHSEKYAEENERKYIINCAWWAKWTDYVNFNLEIKLCDLDQYLLESKEHGDCEYERPQKITNSPLLIGTHENPTMMDKANCESPLYGSNIQFLSERSKFLKPNLIEGL
ncbi:unnamed protein product [Moneuplotes crassus]|uniref:Uncharacterized protein n=1 Tax=Euplotes crassus TaxID=5936 RepID=A0AAD1X6H6_EUPCR|nr:unnamed protein product [Moneuplotes crassus]